MTATITSNTLPQCRDPLARFPTTQGSDCTCPRVVPHTAMAAPTSPLSTDLQSAPSPRGDKEERNGQDGVAAVERCPVCWVEFPVVSLLTTGCGHRFCQSCLGRIMASEEPYPQPTRAKCPYCRADISLFDLRRHPGNAAAPLAHPKNRDLSALKGRVCVSGMPATNP